MHYTLHLTNNCNMACRYCYVDKGTPAGMSLATAQKAIDMAACEKDSAGIIFFGGEPLLCKELLWDALEYCKWKQKNAGGRFHFKVTTNGLLLDEAFIEHSLKENLLIAMSHDGVKEAHDSHRLDSGGKGTFDVLSEKIDLLLSNRPYAPVLMVVNPDTVRFFAESVRYLYGRGFRYIVCSMNYAAAWTETDLEVLKGQYAELARFYLENTIEENKFYLSPFEVKISSHINRASYCKERCELGKRQISVAPDGTLYPCVQFVGDSIYSIGNVASGIDEEKREALFEENEEEKESCRGCAIKARCNNRCGCMNRQATGSIGTVSSVLCAHERILMPIADRLAEKLYRKRSPMFIQKHYNDMYPLLSLIEDKKRSRETSSIFRA